jgi:Zn-dependent peptidase ImmA (M78 family)
VTYSNPGRLFLNQHGRVETVDDVLAYVEFLRKESGVNTTLPINLFNIFSHFDFHKPKILPLPNVDGMLVDPKNGIIVINSDDTLCRQKFTLAHELIEVLFELLPSGIDLGNGWKLKRPGGFSESAKENLCNLAAACLLMPYSYIEKQIQEKGVNFECARKVADDCEVSLSAALIQLARMSPFPHNVVLWKMKHKPSEMKNSIPNAQLFFADLQPIGPSKKLRVEWSFGNSKAPFIPKNKSIEESSLVYLAWHSQIFTSGIEIINLSSRQIKKYRTQNNPFTINDETVVLSLLEKIS